ncbi:hypothetical protein [Jeongeupia chitinilytica]|uniref:Uncharacterized protein n=1 Tax=Jeongeupia chitinilytica TaxID=1041641 RepID=A0ABQ3H746_9NEIS|nr:hypothetical protein [Jeongeupia chitinilytica]GHD69306.1 hypothetical protein GCM10007350_35910 [Jeongeupia chitinilytica]
MFDAFSTSRVVNEQNTPLYRNFLPEASFIRFEACRLRNASVAWINFDLMSELGVPVRTAADLEALKLALLESFAYMIPNERDDPAAFDLNDTREFLAERYGDFGEQCNGGGVRCGLNGHFQSKGIGRSLLAGRKMDFWHTHGGATIEEGIREAIWGEVFNQELPFGAVRILAVIATGKATAYDFGLLKKEGQDEPPGGLMIRQANLRPAHYQRAPFYQPLKELGGNFVHDAVRTEKAMAMIHKALSLPDNASFNEIITAWQATSEKFAQQVAYSKLLRLAHGSLTQGNIDLSGKYIDFGTTSALSGYGNPVISRGFPAIWHEAQQLAGNVTSLVFYANKYLNPDLATDLPALSLAIEKGFYRAYDKGIVQAALMIAGFPLSILVENDETTELGNLIVAMARDNTLDGLPLATIPDSLGGCDMIGFLKLAAREGSELAVGQCASDVQNYHAIERLVALYREVFAGARTMMSSMGVAEPAFKQLLAGRIDQFAIDLSPLYRDRLQGRINDVIGDHAAGDGLCSAMTSFVSGVLDQSVRTRAFWGEFEYCKNFMTLQPGLAYRAEVYSAITASEVFRYIFADGYFAEHAAGEALQLVHHNQTVHPVRTGRHWVVDFDAPISLSELIADVPRVLA